MIAVDEVRIQDTAAEQAVLGAILTAPQRIGDVHLTPADFFRPAHGAIFAAMLALYEQGKAPDPVLVVAELGKELRAVGGAGALQECMAATPAPGSVGYYAQIVREAAAGRRLVAFAARATQIAQAEGEVAGKVADIEDSLRAVADTVGHPAVLAGSLVDDFLDLVDHPAKRPQPVPTGYADLDRHEGTGVLNPMRGGHLVIVGGRTSSGKSLVGLDMARNCALRLGRPALVASMEMRRPEIMERLVAATASVPLDALQDRPSEEQWNKIRTARARIADAPLWLDDNPHQSIGSLRRLVRRHKPALLVVDYLQLVATANTDPRFRQNAVAALVWDLKQLAADEDLPVVALAQLNRDPDKRRGGIPSISDLRESGAIEHCADVILLLHRRDEEDPVEHPGEVDLIVAKQRAGRTGTVVLTAQTAFATFRDYARSMR